MPNIKLENISFSYKNSKTGDEVSVLQNFNLEIKSGSSTVIMGPSGCGKTTILKLICGLLEPCEGHVYLNGKDASEIKSRDRNISYVSEGVTNYPHYSGFKNIAFPLMIAKVRPEEIRQRVFEAAKQAKIDKFLQLKPKQLSLGQNQRITIARALVKKPDIYVFDEMLASIDETTGLELMRDLRQILAQQQATSIYVTHYSREALFMGDRIVILKDGKIVADGKPYELINSNDNEIKEILGLTNGN